MKLLSALLAVICTCATYAQGYYKIPTDTNHYWRQRSGSFQYQVRYKKDTIIAGKTYNQYAPFGTNYGTPNPLAFVRYGYLRQDTLAKKVYVLDAGFVEHPLYNFSKVQGDTLQMYRKSLNANITCTVRSTFSYTCADGSVRLNQYVDSDVGLDILIEGIGSFVGGIYGRNFNLHQPGSDIVCFGELYPFTYVYGNGDSNTDCKLLYTSVKTISGNGSSGIKAYPNPVKDKLNLEFTNAFARLNFTVINTLGQVIKSSELQVTGPNSEIDLGDLPTAIYYLNIKFDNEQPLIIKLFKE